MGVVVGGVSGSGKTTVGVALAERLGVAFCDGDDLHPPENVAKMRDDVPLTDEDRWPWLEAIGDWLTDNPEGVVVCSALRRAYRDLLHERGGEVDVLLLHGDRELIRERQAGRGQHFMPTTLLDSQFDTLEPLEPDETGITVDVTQDVSSIVDEYLRRRDR